MFGWLDSLAEGISAIIDTIATGLGDLGTSIIDGIKGVLEDLFVPDAESTNTKLNEIKEKFGYVDTLKSTFKELTDYLFNNGDEIPVIYINLGNARGKYNYGTTGTALDMTWYAEYKPAVDIIIIAIVYIMFIFNIYKRLPDIISGAGAITSSAYHISNFKGDKK